jgi:hypothetical protein
VIQQLLPNPALSHVLATSITIISTINIMFKSFFFLITRVKFFIANTTPNITGISTPGATNMTTLPLRRLACSVTSVAQTLLFQLAAYLQARAAMSCWLLVPLFTAPLTIN